jgi:hypothetical protein
MSKGLTADGEPYQSSRTYYLVTEDGSITGQEGIHFPCTIPASVLRANRDDAITDGQRRILAEIDRLRELITRLESEKTPKARTLKYKLMAGR